MPAPQFAPPSTVLVSKGGGHSTNAAARRSCTQTSTHNPNPSRPRSRGSAATSVRSQVHYRCRRRARHHPSSRRKSRAAAFKRIALTLRSSQPCRNHRPSSRKESPAAAFKRPASTTRSSPLYTSNRPRSRRNRQAAVFTRPVSTMRSSPACARLPRTRSRKGRHPNQHRQVGASRRHPRRQTSVRGQNRSGR